MTLMLVMMFSCVGIGLFAPRIGTREQLAIAGLAVAMTTLYFVFATRFMV
jgi:hypothetical protein